MTALISPREKAPSTATRAADVFDSTPQKTNVELAAMRLAGSTTNSDTKVSEDVINAHAPTTRTRLYDDLFLELPLPTQNVVFTNLGADKPAVMNIGKNLIPAINLDSIPALDYESFAGLNRYDQNRAVKRGLAIAVVRHDLHMDGGCFNRSGHPLLEKKVAAVPNFVYRMAQKSDLVREAVAQYILQRSEGDGRIMSALGAIVSMPRALNSGHSIAQEKKLDATPHSPLIVEDLLRRFALTGDASHTSPYATLARSFTPELTKALSDAIERTCQKHGLPPYRGDPWNVLAQMNVLDVSKFGETLREEFKLDDYPVEKLLIESRSRFQRQEGFHKALCARAEQVLDRHIWTKDAPQTPDGRLLLRIGVVGLGLNEEPLTIARQLHTFFEKNNLFEMADFKITVMSTPNPILTRLAKARAEGSDYPLFYPRAFDDDLFVQREEGFVPRPELSDKIEYVASALGNGTSLPHKVDIVACHNVFLYIPAHQQAQAMNELNALTTDNGFISIDGDADAHMRYQKKTPYGKAIAELQSSPRDFYRASYAI